MDLPDDEALRWIAKTFAHLRAAHGEAIGYPVLVQPTSEFFPDEFRSDGPSLERLLGRMLDYAPLSGELRVDVAVSIPVDADQAGGCGSSACATPNAMNAVVRPVGVEELDDGYCVTVAANDLGSPEVLAASLARSVGALVLHEAGEPVGVASSEIAAIVCGFGVLLANGASVWAKACGGLRVVQATTLPVDEIAVAFALFVAVGGHRPTQARKHLAVTQREAFEGAWEWVESNPLIVRALQTDPQRVASGPIALEPVRGLIGQWLHRRELERGLRMPVKPKAPSMTDERRRRIEEVRALLDRSDT